MSTPSDNRAHLLRAWETIDGERRLDRIGEFFADDYVRHAGEGVYGRDEYAAILGGLHEAFPDIEGTLSELVAEGDRVAYRWTSVGTHLGVYLGVPPTHKRVRATGITISRFHDGQIVEDWASWNKVHVLHTLGIIPLDSR